MNVKIILILLVALNIPALAFAESMQDRLKRTRVRENVESETGKNYLDGSKSQKVLKQSDIVVRFKRAPSEEVVSEIKSTMYALSADVTGANYMGQNVMQVTTGRLFDAAEQQAFREAVMKHLIVLDVEFISKDKYKSTGPYKYQPLEPKYKPAKK